jgi:hypothetical protein
LTHTLPEIEAPPRPTLRYIAVEPAPRAWRQWLGTNWIFALLLLGYVLIVLAGRSSIFGADALRYVAYATNLLHGTYSTPGEVHVSGPGYPLVLLPFAFASAWLPAALLNAVFMLAAVLYFQATLRLYVSPRAARLGAIAFGLYMPALVWLPVLMTEALAIFLAAGLIYHAVRALRQPQFSWRHALLAAFLMGYLALTKILYGYVVEISFGVALISYLFCRRELLRRAALVCGLALLVAAPYLVYTYGQTARVNNWGDSASLSLYWMSTPYAGEYGDWFDPAYLEVFPELANHHRAFFARIAPLSSGEQDDLLRRQALENIAEYPQKFAANWVANLGRIFFNYPFSYTPQKLTTYAYLLPNMFIVVFGVICVFLAVSNWRLVPSEVYALLIFAFLGLGATSVPSAYARMLVPLVPFFGLGIFVILGCTISLKTPVRDP